MSNFPCSLTRNITSHSMKNLAFHSLPRWKMIILPILTTSRMNFSLKGSENGLLALGSGRVNQFIILTGYPCTFYSLVKLRLHAVPSTVIERLERARGTRGRLPCSLQSRAPSCISLAPVSRLLREKKGTACSLSVTGWTALARLVKQWVVD